MLRRLMMASAQGPGAGYAEALLALTPKFAWFLDEASGGLVDRSGNGRSAVAVGTPLYAQPSILPNGEGACVYFSGDDYFTAGATLLGPFVAGWLSLWVKKDFSSPYRIFYGENQAGSSNRLAAYMRPDSQGNRIVFNRYASSWPADLESAAPASPSSPMHVVLTGDATGRQVYINGILQGSDSTSWASSPVDEAHLGRAAGDPNNWKGWIQFAAGGNRKLSASEVSVLYAAAA